jgi:hypothetical protein
MHPVNNNITRLVRDKSIKKPKLFCILQMHLLSEAFYQFRRHDSAAKLKLARIFHKKTVKKARYRFVLGQL